MGGCNSKDLSLFADCSVFSLAFIFFSFNFCSSSTQAAMLSRKLDDLSFSILLLTGVVIYEGKESTCITALLLQGVESLLV